MAIVYLALGSNLGDREIYLDEAIRLLSEAGTVIDARSTILETEPLGGLDQPKYLNMVLKVRTNLMPKELLRLCQSVENQLGRKRDIKWGSRTIDVDILFYDNLQNDDPELTLPHPGVFDREFLKSGLKELGKLV